MFSGPLKPIKKMVNFCSKKKIDFLFLKFGFHGQNGIGGIYQNSARNNVFGDHLKKFKCAKQGHIP
jgi:hypothetical protein